MKTLITFTLLLLISCSSTPPNYIGTWKAKEVNMTFVFAEKTLKIIDVMKTSYVEVQNIRTFNYHIEGEKLQLEFVSFKANPLTKNLPDNVIVHDFYAHEKYDGPKTIDCLLTEVDEKTLLFELIEKKKLTLKKLEQEDREGL